MLMRLLALILVLLPVQALAHAQLRAADPAAGTLLEAPPDQVVLTFNERIARLQARWFDPDGQAQDADSRAAGADLIVPVPEGMGRGTHSLSWRVVSDDGHAVGGTYSLSIGIRSGRAAPAPEPVPWVAALARAALTLSLVLGVGGMVWAVLSHLPPPRAIRAALWLVPPSALAILAGQGMDLTGGGMRALADPAAWQLALASPFARAAGLAVAAAGLAATVRANTGQASTARAGTGRRAVVLAAWVLAALSFAVAGHAARAAPAELMAPLMAAHALALIFWAGALPGLVAALRRPDAAQVMDRFSRMAVPMVALLVLSGAALSWRQLQSASALIGTAYGQVLTAKLVLVALVLALALRHRLRLTPALRRDPDAARPAFRRSIRVETALILAILVLTAAFRLTPPPRALADQPESRADVHLHGRQSMADVALIPGRPGPNRVEVTPSDGDFQPFQPLEITLLLSRPAEGLEAVAVPVTRDADGIWRAGPIHLPPGGPVDVVADILITDFQKELIGGTLYLLP